MLSLATAIIAIIENKTNKRYAKIFAVLIFTVVISSRPGYDERHLNLESLILSHLVSSHFKCKIFIHDFIDLRYKYSIQLKANNRPFHGPEQCYQLHVIGHYSLIVKLLIYRIVLIFCIFISLTRQHLLSNIISVLEPTMRLKSLISFGAK